jgi:hypothetical protein
MDNIDNKYNTAVLSHASRDAAWKQKYIPLIILFACTRNQLSLF